ncbi:hypothetical protein CFP56_001103 [Quercus suber]|uniref:Uncharacterized protein n=1 Tax=Quercus suber TaxID=58331 RepID=A0AAW0INU6_QUESU
MLGKLSTLAPLRSVSFSPSFRETDAANLFLGLQFAKPKSSISIFGDKRFHARSPSTHAPSQISRRLVVHETNATDLFVGLRCVKPKKPASVFSLTCLHARPEVSPSTHTPSKTAVDCVAPIPKNPCLLLALLSQKRFAFASIFENTNS